MIEDKGCSLVVRAHIKLFISQESQVELLPEQISSLNGAILVDLLPVSTKTHRLNNMFWVVTLSYCKIKRLMVSKKWFPLLILSCLSTFLFELSLDFALRTISGGVGSVGNRVVLLGNARLGLLLNGIVVLCRR